jgi:hypothetical protein
MSFLGQFSLASPPKTTEKQINELKEQWAQANIKSAKQLERYKELVKFTNTLSEAYVNNIKVTIDVSNLLNAYNELLDEISKGLTSLQLNSNTGVRSEDVERLKNLTLLNIENINKTFTSGYDKVSNALKASSASPEQLRNLETAKISIENLNTSGVRSVLTGGCKNCKQKLNKQKSVVVSSTSNRNIRTAQPVKSTKKK